MALETQPARQRQTATKVQEAPNYISIVQQSDAATLSNIISNPVYQLVIERRLKNEEAIDAVYNLLIEGIEDGTATNETLDQRRAWLTEFNSFIQVMRRTLGSEQAKEITSKTYADFQHIINETSKDVDVFQSQLQPLNKLSELFGKYGADGNIIEKINLAKQQKKFRDQRLAQWNNEHDRKVLAIQSEMNKLSTNVLDAQIAIREKEASLFSMFNAGARLQLEASISQWNADCQERQKQLEELTKEQPEETVLIAESDVEIVNPEILEMQDIGGEAFKTAISKLRDDTELTLAKISANFDSAVEGLSNTRESFISMDRNCGDANIALSILEMAVQKADSKAKQVATTIVGSTVSETDDGLAKLEKLEKEQRSQQILAYSSYLSTFTMDLGIAITSIRSGQTVIQNILRMNAAALQSANTHKITGIANTSDAVTIIIGSIIEVCNRAASRVLADGLTKIRLLAQAGNERLAEGTYEALGMQNEQLEDLVTVVQDLKNHTKEISGNSVELLRKQLELVGQMREESNALSDANADANRARFLLSGGTTKKEQPKSTANFSIRRA